VSERSQSFSSHRRFVPSYHFFAFGILVVNLLWQVYRTIRQPSADGVIAALLAVALLFLFFHARLFPLRTQDRIIRLEERLRLRALLGDAEAGPLIERLTPGQLIGLRFASDGELPGLARAAVGEELTADQIKRRIEHWRADHLRV